jgi:hypothetical protein
MPWCRALKSCSVDYRFVAAAGAPSHAPIDGTFDRSKRSTESRFERDLAAGVSGHCGFNQRVNDQLVELFDVDRPGGPTPLGHYSSARPATSTTRLGRAGYDAGSPGYARQHQYTVATAYWQPSTAAGLFAAA